MYYSIVLFHEKWLSSSPRGQPWPSKPGSPPPALGSASVSKRSGSAAGVGRDRHRAEPVRDHVFVVDGGDEQLRSGLAIRIAGSRDGEARVDGVVVRVPARIVDDRDPRARGAGRADDDNFRARLPICIDD